MAPPLAELTAHARTLTSGGDLVAARAVLADALGPSEPDPQRTSPEVAEAATLLTRILVALGDPHAARIWAGFAHAAEDHLFGSHDERTVAAAILHAAVLHRTGNYGRAAQLYHDLAAELAAAEGPESPRVLAAEADLATAEHAAGHCTAARARMAETWWRHRRVYGDAAPANIKMLARLGAMERECGRATESAEHLALVQELCARYLPDDHPLAVQAVQLARAPASGRHVCGRVERSTGPELAPAPGSGEPDPGEPDPGEPHPAEPYAFPADGPGAAPSASAPSASAPSGYRPERRDSGVTRAQPVTRVTTPERRSPVPAGNPAPRGSWQPLLLVAVLVAGIAVAAAVIVVTLPRAGGPARTAAVPSAATGIDAGPPPGDVRLRDNRDSVSLDWTYPKGAEGPVLISGGRVGEERRAFQQLPAGTSDYVVYGLNDRLDYCFTVSVVYTVEHVAESPAFCTRRQ